MRKNTQKQMPLTITSIDHPHAVELEGISQILDDHPIIYRLGVARSYPRRGAHRYRGGGHECRASPAGCHRQTNGRVQL